MRSEIDHVTSPSQAKNDKDNHHVVAKVTIYNRNSKVKFQNLLAKEWTGLQENRSRFDRVSDIWIIDHRWMQAISKVISAATVPPGMLPFEGLCRRCDES